MPIFLECLFTYGCLYSQSACLNGKWVPLFMGFLYSRDTFYPDSMVCGNIPLIFFFNSAYVKPLTSRGCPSYCGALIRTNTEESGLVVASSLHLKCMSPGLDLLPIGLLSNYCVCVITHHRLINPIPTIHYCIACTRVTIRFSRYGAYRVVCL